MSETTPVLSLAEEYATRAVPQATPEQRVASVREALIGRRFESAEDVAVVDHERFLGLVRIEDLLSAEADLRIEEIMEPDPPVVAPGTNQERAARQAVVRHEASLAVVDGEGHFIGLIPPARMLAVLYAEHIEDIARLSGYLHDSARARTAAEESVGRRFAHRLPWLLIGLAGALLSALLLESFEQRLQANVILAFFIPGIVYLADAVGTQTEALVIRGLSVQADLSRTVPRELVTGALVGATLALAFLPIGLVLWDRAEVVAVVALALFAACSVATLVALTLPALLARLGTDPAFGSGPLATVIQDLLSILIYFLVASLLLT